MPLVENRLPDRFFTASCETPSTSMSLMTQSSAPPEVPALEMRRPSSMRAPRVGLPTIRVGTWGKMGLLFDERESTSRKLWMSDFIVDDLTALQDKMRG